MADGVARGTFDVELTPGPPELDGAVQRFELSKVFHGDLEATGRGLMLSAGDPASGAAGYVAVETVQGHLGEQWGGFALQQFGTLRSAQQTLYYEVVPGSGHGELQGIAGALRLEIDDDGTHRYTLDYTLAPSPPADGRTAPGS